MPTESVSSDVVRGETRESLKGEELGDVGLVSSTEDREAL